LRSSKRKHLVNAAILEKLEIAIRVAKKQKSAAKIAAAIKLVDRAAKKNVFHKNKAARIKSAISKLAPKTKKK